ncbi:type 1 glutamine amidotransferase [Nocardioides dongxiaopingii]|uniref:type 1 glutamine amidotransferase n=1 Tax=Nocardioides sp. S-1144 TaxID=2582905 RepID=UPI00110D5548|nr:type 1 glutamine amidotransferase [Nocardioides sp. S-1144]QCW51133.1 type 1 glutamine amidotransferase [Nocardioides sp. S-1144]
MTVLVIQHEDDCPPALVGRWLAEAGVGLDVRRPYAGDPLPDDLAGHTGLLVLGGPMAATDDAEHAWLAPTRALLRDAVAADVATLGICLGHQLLAAALGGTSAPNPAGQQRGLLPVGWTAAALDDELVAPLQHATRHAPQRCLHWNVDVVTALPPGAEVLALAPGGEVQAARFAPRAWGVQPHPEVDRAVVERWGTTEPDAAADALAAEVGAAADELETTWRPLATSFARVVAGAGVAS